MMIIVATLAIVASADSVNAAGSLGAPPVPNAQNRAADKLKEMAAQNERARAIVNAIKPGWDLLEQGRIVEAEKLALSFVDEEPGGLRIASQILMRTSFQQKKWKDHLHYFKAGGVSMFGQESPEEYLPTDRQGMAFAVLMAEGPMEARAWHDHKSAEAMVKAGGLHSDHFELSGKRLDIRKDILKTALVMHRKSDYPIEIAIIGEELLKAEPSSYVRLVIAEGYVKAKNHAAARKQAERISGLPKSLKSRWMTLNLQVGLKKDNNFPEDW